MLVFRIENENKNGPWHGDMPLSLTYKWGQRHDDPIKDGAGIHCNTNNQAHTRLMSWLRNNQWKCGFASRAQLRMIVYPGELKNALTSYPNYYIGVYKIHKHYTRVLNKQTVFLIEKATLIRKIRFTKKVD